MKVEGEEQTVFEIALVFSKKEENGETEDEGSRYDAFDLLVEELKKTGLLVEAVPGLAHEFIKVRFFCS